MNTVSQHGIFVPIMAEHACLGTHGNYKMQEYMKVSFPKLLLGALLRCEGIVCTLTKQRKLLMHFKRKKQKKRNTATLVSH